MAICNRKSCVYYFNSHAHVERDGYVRKYCQNYIISTHTLTWSVTQYLPFYPMLSDISTHTLTWSVTRLFEICNRKNQDFNSHAHVERDKIHYLLINGIWYFNSHAHVERDLSSLCQMIYLKHFNSHAHVERDVILPFSMTSLSFQLTRSRGA